MADSLISRIADEGYLDTVARAMTTADVRQTGTDYHRLDYSEVLTVANTEHTPLSARLGRREAARDIKHFWLEQYVAGSGAINPVAETADPSNQNPFLPTRFENTMMKLGRKFIISDEMNIIARAGGLIAVGTDEWGRQMSMQLTMLLRDQEAALLRASLADTSPRQMRGILGSWDAGTPLENGFFGKTADGGIEQGGRHDLGGVKLIASGTPGAGEMLVEKALNDFMLQIYNMNAGPFPNVVYVPPRALKLLQDAAKDKVTVFMTQAELAQRSAMNLGGAMGKYYTDFGMIDVVAHPLLPVADTVDGASGNLITPAKSRFLFLYEPGLSMIDYIGYGGIHVEPRAKTDPTETRIVSEIFSLEVRYLKSHGYCLNFWLP